ncbi:uncharacterized protein G2W53_018925 [Senna tora]|uniref:Uncharacterized protein n=1 Tax=Senna tora TaxID=362788 RepID=A0A834TW58_9FABA|nr:uncharacterized protein G2W53_018925 [Senna tora]
MLENPPSASPLQSAPTDSSSAPVKRYTPPNQRNRSHNRRKSADRLDRANSLGNDVEKNQHALSRSVPVTNHGDAGSSNLNENHYSGFIALEGCSYSVASQLLNDRVTYCFLIFFFVLSISEKPVMHSGGTAPAWTQLRLPHQIMASTQSTPASASQLDFLGELRRQMQSANSGFNP